MTLRPLFPVTQQFQNKNGSNLVGGKVYVYFQGRTALATTYHDEDGTVVNANPVLLDNNGRATVFADTIYSYTIVVCDYYGKELFSQDITLHDAISTAEDVLVMGSDGSVKVDTTTLPNGAQYDLSVNTDIIATKKSVDDVKTDLTNLTGKVDNHTTQIGQIQESVAGIETTVSNKKDKQTELAFNGSATKTVKSITQNANGELNVEFENIDLPQEVPNVNITSEDSSVNITSSVDAITNTKTFDLSVDSITNIASSDGSINVTSANGNADLTLPSDVVRDSAYTHIDASTAGTADRAVADKSGNDIETTYATKSELSTHTRDTTVHITAEERKAWNAKQSALTAGDRITIDGNTISADSQVFYATYGVTKYSEVSEAINNGKNVCVVNGKSIAQLVFFDSHQIIFAKTNFNNNLIILYTVYSNDSWGTKNRTYNSELTFDTTPTAGSTNPVTSDGIKTALNDKFDKYGFFGKTDGKWIGAALSVDGETEVKYWKLCSFKTAKFWSLNFVADVTNAHYDSNVFERKIIAIYGYNPGVVSSALEIREGNNKLYSTRGYGNNIYYEISGNNVTIYIKARFSPNVSQYCRLVSVLSECSISNLTWYQETTAGTQPENPVKFSLGYKTVKPAGSTSVPVYIGSDGNPTACTNDFVHLTSEEHNLLNTILTPPASGTAVLKSVNGVLQWVTE